MNIADLLNPEGGQESDIPPPGSNNVSDISETIVKLYSITQRRGILAPQSLARELEDLLQRLSTADHSPPSPKTPSPSSRPYSLPKSPPNSPRSTLECGVPINRQTTLSKLFRYEDVGATFEYPETHKSDPVGYLVRMDPGPDGWASPLADCVYSWGFPSGQIRHTTSKPMTHPLLCGADGRPVPCVENHKRCQAVKVCPFAAIEDLKKAHTSASREDVEHRLRMDRENTAGMVSPRAEVFQRTAAYIAALRRGGCHTEEHESTIWTEEREEVEAANKFLRRGFVDDVQRCGGDIIFEYSWDGKPTVRCAHYDACKSRTHYIQYLDQSQYDLEYLEAVFEEDVGEISRIEKEAQGQGYGPLTVCTMVANSSSRRRNCPFDHRGADGSICQPLMIHLKCDVRYRIFEPLEQFREECPYVFISFVGEHTHPVPLPTNTPRHIRNRIFEMFQEMDEDIADLTPRRFLRHALTRAYVHSKFPDNPLATLGDVHISLANREHIGMYIKQGKEAFYPEGTAWKGALHLLQIQTEYYPVESKYIRRIFTIDAATLTIHPDDEQTDSTDGSPLLKVIICMTPEASRHFKTAKYPQSDISYKRIKGFRELVIGHWDRERHCSLVFCRVYLNRETAAAHELVFREINNLIIGDTGSGLRWRHLDANAGEDFNNGILQWTGDQGGGQAKGLGLHLQSLAQQRPPKRDIHEPWRWSSDLTEYEHLHRVYRLCATHAQRNIRRCAVTEKVRNDMRSLICMRHPDWDGTLARINHDGGKAGQDWLSNKIASKFALEGLCWEKSLIPEDIWKAGDRNDNLIESSHFDVNQDGRACSLVAGIEKGRRFDFLKLASAKAITEDGIRPSYQTGHPSENMRRSLKRQQLGRMHKLQAEDQKIEQYNTKFNAAKVKWFKIRDTYQAREGKYLNSLRPNSGANIEAVRKLYELLQKAHIALEKESKVWTALVDETVSGLPKGSGKVTPFTLADVFN